MERSHVTPAEWEVMRVIWAHPQSTSRFVIDVLAADQDWRPGTIKTLLGRLVEKGLLATERSGRKFLYTATVGEAETLRADVQEMFDASCDRRAGGLLYALVRDNPLSRHDIERLEELLAEKKQSAPDVVPCRCLPGQCNC